MRLALLTFFILIFPGAALAQYGYVRVIVPKLQPGHHWQVQLHANGKPVGPGFSHESGGYSWVALSREHLNPRGPTTTIYASYGPLASNGCRFDYQVAFSIDGVNELTRSPLLSAPQSGTASTIPLGLGCRENSDRLCSTDPALQRKIVEQANRATLTRYNEWKRDYDDRVRARKARLDVRFEKAENQIKQLKTPDMSSAEEILKTKIKEWSLEAERISREQAERESKAPLPDASVDAKEIAKAAEKSAQATLGEAIVGTGTFHLRVNDLIEREKDFQGALKLAGDEAAVRESQRAVADMEFIQRNVFRGEGFAHVTGEAIALGKYLGPSSLRTGISLCEIVTERKSCVGRELSQEELREKTCSLFLKHFPLWKRLKDKFLSSAASEMDLERGKIMEKLARSGACGVLAHP